MPSLADDSGLCVDALNGMPGVLSARWSGTLSGTSSDRGRDDATNNRLLLDQLADVPDERRGAQFRCAVALCRHDGAGGVAEVVVHGVMPGRVIRELRGDGGFGYDALFVPDDQDGELTSAEMTSEAKDAISHRGRALRGDRPGGRERACRAVSVAASGCGPGGCGFPTLVPKLHVIRRIRCSFPTTVGKPPPPAAPDARASGETRTLTGQDLNLVPLPDWATDAPDRV